MIRTHFLLTVLAGTVLANSPASVVAQVGTPAVPFAPPSPNAALHYQRALLILSQLSAEEHDLLDEEVWLSLPAEPDAAFPGRIARVCYRARHAVEAASVGSRLEICDFGIDFQRAGAATVLPHVRPIVRLGRLLALRGALAESQGDWEEAAIIYLDGLRLGKHLTHQHTLLEAIAGLDILENNYYLLARWAVHCPERPVVERAFGALLTLGHDLIDPARTVASETAILNLELKRLSAAYPEGPWAELILDGLEIETTGDREADRKTAIEKCLEAGVPKDAFSSPKAFRSYLRQLQVLSRRYREAAAACMLVGGTNRFERALRLDDKYGEALGVLGQDGKLRTAEVAALFATHEAQQILLACVLALAAHKDDGQYPETLEEIVSGFGVAVPSSPFDASAIRYEPSDDRRSFRIGVGEVKVGSLTLPEIQYSSAAPVQPTE